MDDIVVVRGAGDLASGVILRLMRAGYKVVALETDKPTSIRRTVSFSEAVYDGRCRVEDVEGVLVKSESEAFDEIRKGNLPVMVDPWMKSSFGPFCIIDAIIAKKNLGTRKGMAPFVIALGPGFEAGVDADCVIETKRGHTLGRVIWKGSAIQNTGIPGIIAGYGAERVIHSPSDGTLHSLRSIGDIVSNGEIIAYAGDEPVHASIDGMLRGLIRDGFEVWKGMKIADIDPRGKDADYLTVSDKALAIAGGVLEALDGFSRKHALF